MFHFSSLLSSFFFLLSSFSSFSSGPACKTQFCFDCSRLLHPGLSWDANKLPDFEEKFQEWLKAKNALVKQCPVCAAHREKNDGCNHMYVQLFNFKCV